MPICKACNKRTLVTSYFSDVCLCNDCSKTILLSEWRDRNFDSINDVKNERIKILTIANSSLYLKNITKQINDYFNELINSGFLESFDGNAGQQLLIFNDYLIVKTKSDLKRDELISRFGNFIDIDMNIDDEDDDLKTLSNIGKIGKGLLRGNLVAAGLKVAADSVLSEKIKEKKEEQIHELAKRKAKNLINTGDRVLYYYNFQKLVSYSSTDSNYGYIKFVPNNTKASDMFNCEYFFFKAGMFNGNKDIKNRVEIIKNTLNKKLITVSNDKKEQINKTKNDQTDNFTEIRKFKELLDEGIISEEEFNKKKKDLLNL